MASLTARGWKFDSSSCMASIPSLGPRDFTPEQLG
jgi:hypothetical protein